MPDKQVIPASLGSAVQPDAGACRRSSAFHSPPTRSYAMPLAWNAERAIFEQPDPDAEAAADARAGADIRAGRTVDHAEVAVWLAKWGIADETAAPPEWLA